MRAEAKTSEKLKAQMLEDLRLMRADDYKAYWRQVPWNKPNLVQLAKDGSVRQPQKTGETNASVRMFTPLRYALTKLPPRLIASASRQPDPFGRLLERMDVAAWSEFCRTQGTPWITRVWLAAASQLLAERRLIFKAHGWSDTWETLRRNPHDIRAAENFHLAELRHSKGERRTELLAIRMRGSSKASRQRLRRSKNEAGKRDGVSAVEKYIVQHWLELPAGLPGLCFFSDPALHELLELFKLTSGYHLATKQVRARLGLVQAGAKQHLIEQAVGRGRELRFTGNKIREPWILSRAQINWGTRRLWPPVG